MFDGAPTATTSARYRPSRSKNRIGGISASRKDGTTPSQPLSRERSWAWTSSGPEFAPGPICYLQPDPIGILPLRDVIADETFGVPGGMNLNYPYAAGSPLSWYDNDGL